MRSGSPSHDYPPLVPPSSIGQVEVAQRGPVSGRVIECAAWLILVAALALGKSFAPDSQALNIAAGATSVVFGVRVFLGHGGGQVTILGLANVALALFIGFPGIYHAVTEDNRVTPEYLGLAILAGLTLQVLTAFAGWRRRPVPAPQFPSREVSGWITRWGVGLLLVLVAAEWGGLTSGVRGLTESAAFAATVALTIGLIYRSGIGIVSWQTGAVLLAVLAYTEVFHTGGGRLRIVALLCAVGIVATMTWPRRALKRLAILGAPLALYVLAQYRLDYQESLAYGASAGRTGLESMLVPVVAFARLLEEQAQGWPLAWGWNLLSVPLSYLPAGWLPGAPQALGYELVAFYAPERYGSGFSIAATAAGEAVYNFGLLGILLAAPVLAWLCNFIDRRIRLAAAGAGADRVALVRLAVWVSFGGAIADLVWNGWHVFVTRTLTRLPLFGGLIVVALAARGLDRRSTPPRRVLVNTHGTR